MADSPSEHIGFATAVNRSIKEITIPQLEQFARACEQVLDADRPNLHVKPEIPTELSYITETAEASAAKRAAIIGALHPQRAEAVQQHGTLHDQVDHTKRYTVIYEEALQRSGKKPDMEQPERVKEYATQTIAAPLLQQDRLTEQLVDAACDAIGKSGLQTKAVQQIVKRYAGNCERLMRATSTKCETSIEELTELLTLEFHLRVLRAFRRHHEDAIPSKLDGVSADNWDDDMVAEFLLEDSADQDLTARLREMCDENSSATMHTIADVYGDLDAQATFIQPTFTKG